jgi:hypothetical protein
MSVIGSNIIAGASGVVADTAYQISRSLRFNSADSAYLNRTPGSAGNRKTWTWSGWVKRSALGAVQNLLMAGTSSTDFLTCQIDANNKLSIQGITGNVENIRLVSTPVYRDVSAWYNIVFVLDLNNATQADRFRIYVNGVRVTAFDTNTNTLASTQNYEINNTVAHAMGRNTISSSVYVDLYYADLILIDGQALTPSDFGQTDSATGVWVPKAYTGTYGTNGFWLKFDDNSGTTSTTLGKDSSGNSNNWTPNNFSVTAGTGNDSLVDSPTNYGTDTGAGGEVRGNYATLNNLLNTTGSYANGNLERTTSDNTGALGTICPSSGKWYAEFVWTAIGSAAVGAIVSTRIAASGADGLAQTWQLSSDNRGFLYNAGSSTSVTGWTTNDVIGLAFDCSTGAASFYKNGTLLGTITNAAFANVPVGIGACAGSTSGTNTFIVNFGQRPFAYTAPSGFKALCTQNLPTPAVGASAGTLANKQFDAIIWTGDGTSSRTLSTLNFQPDFVWAKNRSTAAVDHSLYDVLRGAGANSELISNSTGAEGAGNHDQYGWLSAFTANGFTTTKGAGVNYYFNENSATYVAWNWKANGAGVSNNAGSISSTVSANTTAGFSVVTYTGNNTNNATVGHGLGVAPAMMILKCRSLGGTDWVVYHKSLGISNFVYLNGTGGAGSYSGFWNNVAPTSTVFNLASGNNSANGNGQTYVNYCFAEVAGFSKFGSYTGNGSSDGPFVYCGFRPRFIIIKRTDSSTNGDWNIKDTARNTYNSAGNVLFANVSDAEYSSNTPYDILSNGFKLRDTGGNTNASGGTYIFAAFAEFPFQYARAR